MMLYKNSKTLVCSEDEDTDFFDIIIGVLQWDTVMVNESQMEIPAERGQDFVWRVEQRNKTYLKFDVGENRENVDC